MKKILIVLVMLSQSAAAYDINGHYARLIKCTYKSRGVFQGYEGLYEVRGEYFLINFGSNYCEY